jgi:hypothetical protein
VRHEAAPAWTTRRRGERPGEHSGVVERDQEECDDGERPADESETRNR